MNTGLPLLDYVYVPRAKADPLRERWERFHTDNHWVLDTLIRWAWVEIDAGASAVGVKALWERLRWDADIRTVHGAFKADNRYTSLYARAMVERDPRLTDYIELRRRPSEGR